MSKVVDNASYHAVERFLRNQVIGHHFHPRIFVFAHVQDGAHQGFGLRNARTVTGTDQMNL